MGTKKHAYNSRKLQNDKYLVGGWTNPFQKNMRTSNWIISPGIGVTNKTYLSCHHLDLFRPFIRGYSSKRLEKNDKAIYWNICVLKKMQFLFVPVGPYQFLPLKKKHFGNPKWNANKSCIFLITSIFPQAFDVSFPFPCGVFWGKILKSCKKKQPLQKGNT